MLKAVFCSVTTETTEHFPYPGYHFYSVACNAVHSVAVTILSVCVSIRLSDVCIVTKLKKKKTDLVNDALRII